MSLTWLVTIVIAVYLNLILAKKYRYNKILVIVLGVIFTLLSTLVLWLIGILGKKSSKKKGKKKRR